MKGRKMKVDFQNPLLGGVSFAGSSFSEGFGWVLDTEDKRQKTARHARPSHFLLSR
jgi:hypothetical protein